MKASLIMMLIIGPILLNGCATISGYPDRSYDLKAELAALDQYHLPDIINIYNAKTQEKDKKDYRDEVVNARLRAIDLHFGIFEQEVARENIIGNVAVDWAVLALGGATALSPSSTAKSIMGGISGGLTGAKGSVDKNVFYNKTMPVLLAEMEALRKEVLVRIREGLMKSTSDYPLTQALIDLDDYYKAGTIPGALIGIAATAGQTIKEKEKELRGIYLKTKVSERIMRFWMPDGENVFPASDEKIKKWLKDHKIDSSIPFFALSDKFKEEQPQMIKDLGIP